MPEPMEHELVPETTGKLSDDFALVTVKKGDTFSSLARRYYKDSRMGWYIAEQNNLNDIVVGTQLYIPLKPIITGGVSEEKVQIVPVLCYHKFSERKADTMTVTRAEFEEQMKYLKENDFNVLSLDQLFDFLDHKAVLPTKSVVITLDDGWQSAYDIAYPILKKYGFSATYFVYTDLITGGAKTLSWGQLNEMAANGIDLENHTKAHMNLAEFGKEKSLEDHFKNVVQDLQTSARLIKEKTGKQVEYLAYPYGSTNALVKAVLKQLGYKGAFTVQRGGSPFFTDNFLINRSMVFGGYSLKKFQKNLRVVNTKWIK